MKLLLTAFSIAFLNTALGEGSASPQAADSNEPTPPVEQRIEPGMAAAKAIDFVGRAPDETTVIGAACGMLEVLTWHGEKTRIITNAGFVSSVVESDLPKPD